MLVKHISFESKPKLLTVMYGDKPVLVIKSKEEFDKIKLFSKCEVKSIGYYYSGMTIVIKNMPKESKNV